MTTIAPSRIVDVAKAHLGESAPVNTCVKLGMRTWPAELGLAVLPTDSVSEAEALARKGTLGWRYVEGTHGIRPGYFGDWQSSVLRPTASDPNPRHVSIVELMQGDRWRGIGAGTPSGKVALQPSGGGTNTLDVLRGYFVPPTETAAAAPASHAPKPAAVHASSSREHRVVKGDTVWGIARHYGITQQALLRANPALPTRRSADYHIASPSLIVIGQRLHVPR